MSKRTYQLFNLSFLDIMTAALAAIMFLFIIVDKGGGVPPSQNGDFPLVYLSLDSLLQKFHGTLPDSLMGKKPGEKILVMIDAIRPEPPCEDTVVIVEGGVCPPIPPPCRVCPPACPNPKDHNPKWKPTNEENNPACPNPADHTALRCDDPKCQAKESEPVYKLAMGLPLAAIFVLEASSNTDEIDLQICKDGRCVNGGRKRDTETELVWIKMALRPFEAGKGIETIFLQRNDMLAGTYQIQGRLSCKSNSATNAKVTITTQTAQKKYNKKLQCGNQWVTFGTIAIDKNGKITESK